MGPSLPVKLGPYYTNPLYNLLSQEESFECPSAFGVNVYDPLVFYLAILVSRVFGFVNHL